MKQLLFTTDSRWSGLMNRLTLGIILFPHGAQKMLGAFGGYGFSGSMGYFTETLHLPWVIGLMVIVIEFVGALCLIAGFASKIWSGLILLLMIGIIFTSHVDNGFFMNWFGNQKGEGFEYHLLVIGLCLSVFFTGSGKFSLDNRLFPTNN